MDGGCDDRIFLAMARVTSLTSGFISLLEFSAAALAVKTVRTVGYL